MERSSSGIKGINRIFKAMDQNGNGLLDVDDFRWGFIDYGIDFLTHEDALQLLQHFDHDKNGSVSFNEFLKAIKGEMNEQRKELVRAAFAKLDLSGDGKINLEEVA